MEEATAMTQILADNGMTIYAPSEQLVADLQGIGATMLESWNASASDAAKTVLSDYRGE